MDLGKPLEHRWGMLWKLLRGHHGSEHRDGHLSAKERPGQGSGIRSNSSISDFWNCAGQLIPGIEPVCGIPLWSPQQSNIVFLPALHRREKPRANSVLIRSLYLNLGIHVRMAFSRGWGKEVPLAKLGT